jgi:hypothetical protein
MRDMQPGQGSNDQARGRLARISHHFLSDNRTLRVLAVGVERGDDSQFCARLARALAGLGITVALVEDDDCLVFYTGGRALRREPILAPERLKDYWEDCRSPGVLMLPAEDALGGHRANVLIPVPVDDVDMRQAYRRLKQIASGSVSSVGITITGTSDRFQAEAAYQRFAAAAYRFLGLEVASYSYLLGGWTPAPGIDPQFENIAALLVEDWRKESPEKAGRDTAPSPTIVASEEIV